MASAYAQSNHILQADKVDVETGGLVMMQYTDDLFMTIDNSWSKPLNYPAWGGLTMELVSERGLTVVDVFNQKNWRLLDYETTNNSSLSGNS